MRRTCEIGVLAALALFATPAFGGCPFLSGQNEDAMNSGGDRALMSSSSSYDSSSGGADFSSETYQALQADITTMFTDSQDFWPADFGNYAPFMIRLAWHCNGNYRQSDGRGGCDGGRIRFNPERSWADNTNLDKSLTLLQPIKLKYGDAVSWGDLITLTGNEAIRSMGGPVLGFCAGRQDDASGVDSLELGPSPEQEAVAPCAVNGTCEAPLGTSTVGLIYGKFHGACATGPGADPIDAPEAPWPGTCGDANSTTFGRAENTFTSGFEGQWTVEPLVWDNEYFKDLLEYDWVMTESPADLVQWFPVLKEGATETEDEIPDIIMLTSDIALLNDLEYLALVELFASDQAALDEAFAASWYKLTSRDMGQFQRCVGTDVAPPQDFQLPLPDAPADNPDSDGAASAIVGILSSDPSYPALFVTLAWQCASTFRATDYLGGCNGARIRFSPEKDWAGNQGLDEVLSLLEPVRDEYPDMSYADLIVLSGNLALDIDDLPFCAGRVDAAEGDDLISVLEPREYDDVIVGVRDRAKIMGLSVPQAVALAGRPRSASHMVTLGFSGSYTVEENPALSNAFYTTLLTETWEEVPDSEGLEYQAVGTPGVYALATDLALVWDPELKAQTVVYAEDNDEFLKEFASAWTAVMIADRYDGPTGNVCEDYYYEDDDSGSDGVHAAEVDADAEAQEDGEDDDSAAPTAAFASVGGVIAGVAAVFAPLLLEL
ncbi:unnamed protein product [Ectocarpus sp. 8 AP-2014]